MIKFLLIGPFYTLCDISNDNIVNVTSEVDHFVIKVETVKISTISIIEDEAAYTIFRELVNCHISCNFKGLVNVKRSIAVGFEECIFRLKPKFRCIC